jgi:signal peptidase I
MAALSPSPADKQLLLTEVLGGFGHARLRVTGTSMLPTLWPGDVVALERTDPEALCVGDVILFQEQERLFLHRIVAIDHSALRCATRGDAMPQADPQIQCDQILAKAVSVENCEGRIVTHLRPPWFAKLLGSAVAHSDFAGRLALRFHEVRRARTSRTTAPRTVYEA